jgi:GNAT superfamily N-acetyltransferase
MKRIRFRAFKSTDRGKIKQMVENAFGDLKVQSWADPAWWRDLEGHEEYMLDDAMAARNCIMGSLDSKDLGFGSYDPEFAKDTAFISYFCIQQEFQRKGFGKQLIQFLIEQMKQQRVSRVLTTLHMHPFFLPAYYTLQSLKFEVVDSSLEYNVQKLSFQLTL